MKGEKRFLIAFSYLWHWYLLIMVACVGLGVLSSYLARTPRYEECLYLFIASATCDSRKLESDLLSVSYSDPRIKAISIDHSNPDDFYFPMVFSTRGSVNTDIIILPRGYFGEESYPAYFSSLNDSMAEYVSNYASLEKTAFEGKPYGIKADSLSSRYGFVSGSYFIFFNKNSKKASKLNSFGENSVALEAVGALYE